MNSVRYSVRDSIIRAVIV